MAHNYTVIVGKDFQAEPSVAGELRLADVEKEIATPLENPTRSRS